MPAKSQRDFNIDPGGSRSVLTISNIGDKEKKAINSENLEFSSSVLCVNLPVSINCYSRHPHTPLDGAPPRKGTTANKSALLTKDMRQIERHEGRVQ